MGLAQSTPSVTISTTKRFKNTDVDSKKNGPTTQFRWDKKQWIKSQNYMKRTQPARVTVVQRSYPPLGFDPPKDIEQRCRHCADIPLDRGSKQSIATNIIKGTLDNSASVVFNSSVARQPLQAQSETSLRPLLGPGYYPS